VAGCPKQYNNFKFFQQNSGVQGCPLHNGDNFIYLKKGCNVDPWGFCGTNFRNVSEIEIKTCTKYVTVYIF